MDEPADDDERGSQIQVEVDDLAVAFGAASKFAVTVIYAWVRFTTHRLPAWTGGGHALRAISPWRPNTSSSARVPALS
jgi:hypothetical protein